MELGQLTAEGDAPLRAEGVHEVVQRRAQLVGCFVAINTLININYLLVYVNL